MEGKTTCGPSGLVGAKCEQPKGWMQLSDTEKIERLRDIIKQKAYWENRVYQLERNMQKLRELLVKHSHNDKEVVAAIEKYDNIGADCAKAECSGGSNQKPEEVYF